MISPGFFPATLGLLIAFGAGLYGLSSGGVTAGDWLVAGLLLIAIGGLIHVCVKIDTMSDR